MPLVESATNQFFSTVLTCT